MVVVVVVEVVVPMNHHCHSHHYFYPPQAFALACVLRLTLALVYAWFGVVFSATWLPYGRQSQGAFGVLLQASDGPEPPSMHASPAALLPSAFGGAFSQLPFKLCEASQALLLPLLPQFDGVDV